MVNGGPPSVRQILDWAFRYGATTIIALYLVYNITDSTRRDHEVLMQRLDNVSTQQVEITRTLDRINSVQLIILRQQGTAP